MQSSISLQQVLHRDADLINSDEKFPELAFENNGTIVREKLLFRVCAYIPEGFVLENLTSAGVEFAVLRSETIDGVPIIHDVIDVFRIEPREGHIPKFLGGVTTQKKAPYHEATVAEMSKVPPQSKTFYGVKDCNNKILVTRGLKSVRILKDGQLIDFLECGKPFSIDAFQKTAWNNKICPLPRNWTPSYTIESSCSKEGNTEMFKNERIFKFQGGKTGSHILCHPNQKTASMDQKYRYLLEANRLLLGKYVQAYYDTLAFDLKEFKVICQWNQTSAFNGFCKFDKELPKGYGEGVYMVITVKKMKIRVRLTKIGMDWFCFRVQAVSETVVLSIYDRGMIAGIEGIVQLILLDPEREPVVHYIDHCLERNLRSHAESGEGGTAAGIGLQLLRGQEINRRDYNNIRKKKITCKGITLDEEQQLAVDSIAFHRKRPPFSVLTACPGTGKTLCAAAMIEATALDGNSLQLVLAATNYAVDNMADVLHRAGNVRILRIFSQNALRRDADVEPEYGLNKVISKLIAAGNAELNEDQLRMFQEYQIIAEQMKNLEHVTGAQSSKAFRYGQLKGKKEEMTPKVYEVVMAVHKPQVILTTTDFYLRHRLQDETSTDAKDAITEKIFDSGYSVFFSKQRFRRLLLEEASQLDVIRFTVLMAVSRTIDQIVLVGDPKQMPPYYSVNCDPVFQKFGHDSVLDLLLANKSCIHFTLSIGYRSHPKLQDLTQLFYKNLQRRDSPKLKKRWMTHPDALWNLWGPAPVVKFSKKGSHLQCGPLMFLQVRKGENETNLSSSRFNKKEAEKAVELIKEALESGVQPQNIGVICLYNGQMALMMTLLKESEMPHEGIEVATVDSFQGREKHYILLLTTRSAGDFKGAFIADEHRMNVATSRAIHGMVILGHPWMRHAWPKVYEFCERNGVIKEVRER